MSNYQTLLDALKNEEGELAKSTPASREDNARQGNNGADGGAGDDLLAKAITVTDENGEEVMAFDAGELIKAFGEKVDGVNEELGKALVDTLKVVQSQGERIAAADKQIAEQGDLIKSLSDQVEKLSDKGAGRRSTLSVHERESALTKGGDPEGIKPGELLSKAQVAAEKGDITWTEAARLEAQLLRGPSAVDMGLVQRIVGE